MYTLRNVVIIVLSMALARYTLFYFRHGRVATPDVYQNVIAEAEVNADRYVRYLINGNFSGAYKMMSAEFTEQVDLDQFYEILGRYNLTEYDSFDYRDKRTDIDRAHFLCQMYSAESPGTSFHLYLESDGESWKVYKSTLFGVTGGGF